MFLDATRRTRILPSALWLVMSIPPLVVGVAFSHDLGFRSPSTLLALSLFVLCVVVALVLPAKWRAALSGWIPWI